VATISGTSKDDILFIASGSINETLLGLEGDDSLDALTGGGNNILRGGDGNDELFAYTNDQLFGDAGNDTLSSDGNGSNFLFGGDGNDTIFTDRNDIASGDAGDDFIYAGSSRNILKGGLGKDTFYLTPAGIPALPSEILDFTKGQDKAIITAIPEVKTFNDVLKVQVGPDAVLKVNADGAIQEVGILRNFQADTLTPVDFGFEQAPINNAPDANPDKTITLAEDSGSTPLGITAPTDKDGDPLTLAVNTIPDSTKGQIRRSDGTLVAAGGSLTSEQLTNLAFVPVENANGSAGTFSYSVSDGKGGSDSQAVTINITPVNDAPVADPNKTLTILEDSAPATLGIKAPTDVDGDPLTLKVTAVPDSAKGVIRLSDGTVVANGTALTLQQLQTLVFAPASNANGAAGTFSYTVSDGQGGTASQSIAIAITPGGKGGSVGDPHIFTFDGFHYDFQAKGDFVLVRALDSDLEVQVRQTPWDFRPETTINTGLATVVDGNRVEFYADQSFLWVNNLQVSIEPGQSLNLGKGSISRTPISGYGLPGDLYTIAYPNGDVLNNSVYGGFLLDPVLDLANSRNVVGLLGNNNGNADDDLALLDGTILADPLLPEKLYGEFADSWRVSEGKSLFSSHASASQVGSEIANPLSPQPDLNALVKQYTFGGNDDDILVGAGITRENSGTGAVDILMGNKGADTFVLGDQGRKYYVGSEQKDYALIADFWSGDAIQLQGNANDYVLGSTPTDLASGTGIFLASNPKELIGLIQGVSVDNVSLSNLSIFHFV
jgi:Bacterial Ig domain/von Willebrand factor type D domain/RTX calcium-binding nonapeptide repeat (4 copies)